MHDKQGNKIGCAVIVPQSDAAGTDGSGGGGPSQREVQTIVSLAAGGATLAATMLASFLGASS